MARGQTRTHASHAMNINEHFPESRCSLLHIAVPKFGRKRKKKRHDRCKPRSHGRSENGARVRPLLGRLMAMHSVACAGLDRVRTGNQDIGTRRRSRAEKSRSRRDHQNQAGSTGLNNRAKLSIGGGSNQAAGLACRGGCRV